MSRAERPLKAAPTPRACERPERSGGPGRRENLERSSREEAGFRDQAGLARDNVPAGEILSPDRLAGAPAGSSALRDMQGWSCEAPIKATIGASAWAFHISSICVETAGSILMLWGGHSPGSTTDTALYRVPQMSARRRLQVAVGRERGVTSSISLSATCRPIEAGRFVRSMSEDAPRTRRVGVCDRCSNGARMWGRGGRFRRCFEVNGSGCEGRMGRITMMEPASVGHAPGIEARKGRDAVGGSVYESPSRGLARAGADHN
jgi:hypothetical protein